MFFFEPPIMIQEEIFSQIIYSAITYGQTTMCQTVVDIIIRQLLFSVSDGKNEE